MPESTPDKRGAEHVYDALVDAGVDLLVEVPGHQSIPLDVLLHDRDDIAPLRVRHETAMPHVAWGYAEAGGGLAATLSVPGPGDTNAMHGLRNALVDRVPLVHLTADVDPDHRGRGAIHELDPETLDPVVKRNVVVSTPTALPGALAAGIDDAVATPAGPVRFSIPASFLEARVDGSVDARPGTVTHDADAAIERAAGLLSAADRPLVFVDNGVRRSPGGPAAVRELVTSLDVPVLSSYKGVGVVPGDDPRSLGTTGLSLTPGTERVLERADVVLALGAYFDGPSTRFWQLPMGERLVHVTVEPDLVGLSYEPDVAVVGDVAAAVRGLTERLDGPVGWDGSRIGRAVTAEYRDRFDDLGLYDDRSPAPSAAVFRTLRERLPPETVAVIDIGNFRPWALLEFEFFEPETVVTPGSWTGMGVGLPGAIGAKLANPDAPVVALVGDGCLLMSLQELHTAAEYDIDVTTVVLNNADYNIISREPTLREAVGERHFGWDSPDFAALAEAFGCVGLEAASPSAAGDAVDEALSTDRPTLIDVRIDPDELTPRQAADYESAVDLGA